MKRVAFTVDGTHESINNSCVLAELKAKSKAERMTASTMIETLISQETILFFYRAESSMQAKSLGTNKGTPKKKQAGTHLSSHLEEFIVRIDERTASRLRHLRKAACVDALCSGGQCAIVTLRNHGGSALVI